MFNPEFPVCFWRPVFDGDGHMLDIFSSEELIDIGGREALAKALKGRQLYAGPITPPKSLVSALNGQDVIVILHSETESEDVHRAYGRLGLQREAILFPK